MTPEMTSLLSTFEATCREAGLDIVHAFNLRAYNASAPVWSRIPDFGRESALGIVVGNTRALWPIFKGALAASAALREAADPLDDYVMSRIATGVGIFAMPSAILWAHVTKPEPMPIQRVAEAAGLARIAPSHLNIHATFGPWFTLRAVVALDTDGPIDPPEPAPDRCTGCPAPCMPALERAIQRSGGAVTGEAVRGSWGAWVEVRDACPEGRLHRYSNDQIEYHYAKNRAMLLAAEDEP